jgi:hypothetical protein
MGQDEEASNNRKGDGPHRPQSTHTGRDHEHVDDVTATTTQSMEKTGLTHEKISGGGKMCQTGQFSLPSGGKETRNGVGAAAPHTYHDGSAYSEDYVSAGST